MNDGGSMKHTQGPYKATIMSDGEVLIDTEQGYRWSLGYFVPKEVAYLFAAAPELLEALQWMVKHDPENAYFTRGLEKAKAAIAKATGEG